MTDDYVCTLDAASVKKAADELNELPSDRLAAVQSLRQWVQQQPHIKCPTDNRYLLAFLRARKFSQLEARALLEKHLGIRTKLSSQFHNIEPHHKISELILSRGGMTILPTRDKEGRMVTIMRPGTADATLKQNTKLDEYRVMTMIMDSLYLINEMNQVNGVVVIMDLGGFSFKHQRMFTLEDNKTMMKVWTGGYPARIKGMHFFNVGAMMEFLSIMIKFVLSDTIKDRLHVHGQVLEGLYKHVPMEILPDDYLPDDYEGPSAGSWETVQKYTIDYLMNEEMVKRLQYVSSDRWGIDESKRPKDVSAQSQSSFRKLNID